MCEARFEKQSTPWESWILVRMAFLLFLRTTIDNPKKSAEIRLNYETTLGTVYTPMRLRYAVLHGDLSLVVVDLTDLIPLQLNFISRNNICTGLGCQ